SRRRHTRFSRDWSSDVCSSDLNALAVVTMSKGFKTEILLLSPAENEPAEIVTVSREFTSSRNSIFRFFISETVAVSEKVSKDTNEAINVFVPSSEVSKEKFPFSSEVLPS